MFTYILLGRLVDLLMVLGGDVDADDYGVCGCDCGTALLPDDHRDYVRGCCGHHYDDYWNDAFLVLTLLVIFHYF